MPLLQTAASRSAFRPSMSLVVLLVMAEQDVCGEVFQVKGIRCCVGYPKEKFVSGREVGTETG
jgi:hypothetical protein